MAVLWHNLKFILGHIISAFVGVTCYKLLGGSLWIAAPLAVSVSIIAMQMAKSLHPPGGATALIAVTGGSSITNLGYEFIFFSCNNWGNYIVYAALIFNNITPKKTVSTKVIIQFYKRTRSKKS